MKHCCNAGGKDEFDMNSIGLSNEIMRFDAITYVILSGPFLWEAEQTTNHKMDTTVFSLSLIKCNKKVYMH